MKGLTMTDSQKAARKRVLTELSRALYEIIQETPGVGSLAPTLEQAYESLPKAKRVTIAMVVDAYEKQREDAITRAAVQTNREEVTPAETPSAKEARAEEDKETAEEDIEEGEYIPPAI